MQSATTLLRFALRLVHNFVDALLGRPAGFASFTIAKRTQTAVWWQDAKCDPAVLAAG